eukprot:30910-Pelagococcus_subviridis.AAC.2
MPSGEREREKDGPEAALSAIIAAAHAVRPVAPMKRHWRKEERGRGSVVRRRRRRRGRDDGWTLGVTKRIEDISEYTSERATVARGTHRDLGFRVHRAALLVRGRAEDLERLIAREREARRVVACGGGGRGTESLKRSIASLLN